MSDFSLLDEDFDRYVIGFTENHFIPSDTNSPTPSDHTPGHNSFALDFAERSNRGELKIFLDHSFHLDKKKRQSVSKIHNNILDLMFELSERRKIVTPLLSKSAMELHRSDSRFSDISNASIKTVSSLPLIEVQQLPPIIQPNRSMPSFSDDLFGLPVVEGVPGDKRKQKKKAKKERNKDKLRKGNAESQSQDPPVLKHENLQQTLKKTSEERARPKENPDENNNLNETETKDYDLKNVRFTIGDARIKTEDDTKSCSHKDATKSEDKWKVIDEKIKEADEIVKKKGDSFNEYKGRYFSFENESAVRKMSFCQSSYKERTERERMNNIRRRHSSQTNVGPLDFNKLRRQLTSGRSRTMLC